MRGTYDTHGIATLADLAALLAKHERPVLLVEGIRAISEAERALVVSMGRILAERLPAVVFRSGNAEGTDTAFAEGVTAVDPARMEYVMTHAGMGRKRRVESCRAVTLDELPHVAEAMVAEYTVAASPYSCRLVEAYRKSKREGALGAKAAYLLRDTLKVTGCPEIGLAPAVAGVFYANESDPMTGGTGHTIRVCVERRIPVLLQAVWRGWDKEQKL